MITFKAKATDGEIINSALSPFNFPAGEAHTKREERRELEKVEIAIIQPSPDSLHDDLFQLAMWTNYVQQQRANIRTVGVIPYFPGARADRGAPFGLEVYAEFIGTQLLDQLIVFDPHSPKTLEQNRAVEHTPTTAVYSSQLFLKPYIQLFLGNDHYSGIIAPDKGATDRATAVAEVLNLPVYTAEKTRDFDSGKLSGFKLDGLPRDGRYLIIDDICDRGGTFKGLANAIDLPPSQLDLYVSHGVFSHDAIEQLPNHFGRIFTTNSYQPMRVFPAPFFKLDVIRLLLEKIKDFT
jgi:ribose-phosphate pyrophosphokinase